ncbi:hypothetical protein ALC62_13836 [Cyphomyrmex costatus]|uniref:Uncharacterized protein n=1 Tax=Cyphomyrmex costatus TaxID=456900 RepID=A0A195C5F9_9HYME|nr:hypothetical protein ALC62_13836 [Cyphomyrmex costatus]
MMNRFGRRWNAVLRIRRLLVDFSKPARSRSAAPVVASRFGDLRDLPMMKCCVFTYDQPRDYAVLRCLHRSFLAALSQFIQRNNVIRWLASGINFTTTIATATTTTPTGTTIVITGARPIARAIVAALRHSSPLHCCRPFPAAAVAAAAAADATRCTRALLSHSVKAWRPYGLETLSPMIT